MDVQEPELIGFINMPSYRESVEPLLDKSSYSDFSQSCINIDKIPFASDLHSNYDCYSKANFPNPMFLPLYMRKSADISGLSVFKLVNIRLKYATKIYIYNAHIILGNPCCFDSQYICGNQNLGW